MAYKKNISDKNFLLELYRTMLKIRLTEESFIEPILSGQILTPVHLYTGQEAIATGVSATLKKNDYVFGNHRSHGHYLAKGGNLFEMISEIYCKKSGCSRGKGGSMHLCAPEVNFLGSAPIVGGTISLATGAALASKIRRDKKVTVIFFGDGATGEGALYESINFASLNNLPIIFVCENNFYATHMPILECRKSARISPSFKAMIPFCKTCDGNDVLKVYSLTAEAVEKCRSGKGPAFIEFLTYRMRGHVGPDDNIQGCHTDIRPKDEIQKWKHKDPIKRFEKFLLSKKICSKQDMEFMKENISNMITAAHKKARADTFPESEALKDNLFFHQ